MKKFLSILLTLAMMLSLIIVATLPTAAIDGEWTVVAQGKQETEQIGEDSYSSVAGYHYDNEGFHLDAANWAGHTPWASLMLFLRSHIPHDLLYPLQVPQRYTCPF